MGVVKGFWNFLNTDVKELPWGELADKGIATVLATKDLGKTLAEQRDKLSVLEPCVEYVEPFLKVLEAPVTQMALAGLPFLSVGVGLLRFYQAQSGAELAYEDAIAVTAQLAYLNSLERVLAGIEWDELDGAIAANLSQMSLKTLIDRQLKQLDDLSLRGDEAKRATTVFRESVLAREFGGR